MKGRRYWFSAATSEHGVLRNSIWLFCPQKIYHRSFNAAHFFDYFKSTMSTPENDEPSFGPSLKPSFLVAGLSSFWKMLPTTRSILYS
jgi:hypothetical protein